MNHSSLNSMVNVLPYWQHTRKRQQSIKHKGVLNWLEAGNKPVTIAVMNELLESTFALWRNKEKIYAEATFYKKVASDF